MRYSYEFKRKSVELYMEGKWPETPPGIKDPLNFHKMVRRWVRIKEANGFEALRHSETNKAWAPDERFELVSKVMEGKSIQSVALEAGINSGMLYQWVRKYKTMGYNGLVNLKKGKRCKDSKMKKMNNTQRKLEESEYEELIRLRAENEYIKAENAVIKKEIALREKREAAHLKAKKQQSLKNSGKTDTN